MVIINKSGVADERAWP